MVDIRKSYCHYYYGVWYIPLLLLFHTFVPILECFSYISSICFHYEASKSSPYFLASSISTLLYFPFPCAILFPYPFIYLIILQLYLPQLLPWLTVTLQGPRLHTTTWRRGGPSPPLNEISPKPDLSTINSWYLPTKLRGCRHFLPCLTGRISYMRKV